MYHLRFLLLSFLLFPLFASAQPYDLRIMALDHHAFVTPGTFDCKLSFQNLGSSDIQYFTVKWSLDNTLVDSLDVDVLSTWSYALPPSGGGSNYYYSITIPQAISLATEGEFEFKMWIDEVEGAPDSNSGNDTISYLIHVVDYLPVKHILLEKYSHHTCGPCYQGDINAEALKNNYGNLSIVTIHNSPSDPMSFTDGATLDNFFSYAHPNFVLDRLLYEPNEDYGSLVWNGGCNDLSRRQQMLEGLEVSIADLSYDQLTRELSVTLEAELFANYYENLAFNVHVVEDSVFGYQTSAPDPFNYYHMHVARAVLGGPFGIDITGSTMDGDVLQQTFTYVIPTSFDENQIHVVGFVQRKDGALIDVVNSTDELGINDSWLATKELDNTQLKMYPNPVEDDLFIASDSPVQHIKVYDLSGKLVKQGKGQSISLKELESGHYLVKVQTSKGVSVQNIRKL